MDTTISFHPEIDMFEIHVSVRGHREHEPLTMIQLWNRGATEGALRKALLHPHTEINIKERWS